MILQLAVLISGIDETIKAVQAVGGNAVGYMCDLSNRASIYENAEKVKREVGKVNQIKLERTESDLGFTREARECVILKASMEWISENPSRLNEKHNLLINSISLSVCMLNCAIFSCASTF